MIPRLNRALFLLLGVGLLLLPVSPRAEAQLPSHFESAVGGTIGLEGPSDLSHVRREGEFASVNLTFEAQRRDANPRVLACSVDTSDTGPIDFRAREDVSQGRGFIDAKDPAATGTGTLAHPPGAPLVVDCIVDILPGGVYHRLGTVADVELSIRVRAIAGAMGEVFEHQYCIRGTIAAVPPTVEGEVREDPRCTQPARNVEDSLHG